MKQQALTQTLKDWYRSLIRDSKYRWIIVLGSLLYLVSPIDISPDIFPIIGWIDDGLIATLLVTEISQLMVEQLTTKRKQDDSLANESDPVENAEVYTAEAIDIEAVTVG